MDDLKSAWLNIARRLQSCCHASQCPALLSIQIVLDECGLPVFWFKPTFVPIEPKAKNIAEFASIFGLDTLDTNLILNEAGLDVSGCSPDSEIDSELGENDRLPSD